MPYHIGDRVRVKDWDELVSKWAMRKYCSQIFTVSRSGNRYNLQDDNGNVLSPDDISYMRWAFNDDMLDPVSDQVEPTVSFDELFAM